MNNVDRTHTGSFVLVRGGWCWSLLTGGHNAMITRPQELSRMLLDMMQAAMVP